MDLEKLQNEKLEAYSRENESDEIDFEQCAEDAAEAYFEAMRDARE